MTDIKRLNYFTNQFLVEKDFKDEQAYHLGMRRRHNLLMHTWGVADGGLVVAKVDNHTVSVGAGMAIDNTGAEIVILDTRSVDLTAQGTSTSVFITLQYKEDFDQADHYTTGGVDNYIRTTEYAILTPTKTTPPNDGSVITLAKVMLDNNGVIVNVDTSVRRAAGSNLDPTANLQGKSLTISGDTVLAGKLAVGGSAAPTETLDLHGNEKLNDNNFYLRGDTNHGVGWFGGAKLFAGASPDGPVVFGFMGGALGTTHAGQDVTLFWNDTNVGIGTTAPDRSLTISNTGSAYANIKDGTHELLTGVDGAGGILSVMSNHDLSFRTGSNVEKMRITAGGNTGIGTTTPLYKLHVFAAGGFGGEDANGVALAGGVPIVAQSDSTAIGIINSRGRQAFAINLDVDTSAANRRGVPTLYDKFDGNWHQAISLFNGSVGIGTNQPTNRLHVSDITGIRQNNLFLSGAAGWQSLTFNAYHNAANNNWIFPDQTRPAITVELDDSNGTFAPRFQIWSTSKATPAAYMEDLALDGNTGNLWVRGAIAAGGGKGGYVTDQFVNNLEEAVEQGDLVVLGDNQATLYYGQNNNIPIPEIDLAQQVYDRRVCGIVNEVHPGGSGAEVLGFPSEMGKGRGVKARNTARAAAAAKAQASGNAPADLTKVGSGQIGWMVTLGAYAYCKVDADIAPVHVGDLLTSSPTKGHAQKVLDPAQAVGAIVGKALGSLEKGKGKIPVLVMLQ